MPTPRIKLRKAPPKAVVIDRLSTKWVVGFGLLTTVLFVFVGFFLIREIAKLRPDPNFKIQIIALMPSGHLNSGEHPPKYNSNPPTSGLHSPTIEKWGSYFDAIPDPIMLHNLEHGGIWLTYKDASDIDLILALRDIVQRYPKQVILTYRPDNDSRIAIAAWGKLLKLDALDENQIYDFIGRYRFKGPENG